MKKFLSVLLVISMLFTCMVTSVSALEDETEPLPEFGYYFADYGRIAISSYNGTAENVVIPEEIDGYQVAAISDNAFTKEDKIKTVTIPACVSIIQSAAFNSVETLEKVEFLSNGKRDLIIGTLSFYNCTALDTIILPSERAYSICSLSFWNSAYVKNTANWEGNALYLEDILLMTNPDKIEDGYVVKNGTTVIANEIFTALDEETFSGSRNFKKLVLPNSIKVIGSYNGLNLEALPEDLERIGLYGDINGSEFIINTITDKDKYVNTINQTGYIATEDLHVELIKGDFLLSAAPVSVLTDGLVSDPLYIIPEGIKYIADDYNQLIISLPGKLLSINYSEYVVFPESFEVLPLDNPLCSNFDNILSDLKCNSVTFLNKDTEIYDNEATISNWVDIICGYKGSTAEAYAKKYNRTFVDITNCAHEVKVQRGAIRSNCERSGYSGDTYCGHCGDFISSGNVTPAHYLFPSISTTNYPCEDTMVSYVCGYCDYETEEMVYEPGTGHIDEEFDGRCDYCWDFTDKALACTCKVCRMHVREDDSFFQQIIPIIIVSIWRLFRIKEFCDNCGLQHWNR